MDVSESAESMKVREMETYHFSHPQHPLLFISDGSFATEDDQVTESINCSGCDESLDDGSRYGCKEWKYYLHKHCAELVLAPQIHHPFHPIHLLTLFPKAPYDGGECWCTFCKKSSSGFVYHCDTCALFNLHINCALLQLSIAPNFPNSLHEHRLLFLPNHNDQLEQDCSGCMKPLSGPIYHCYACSSSESGFNLHKKCGEIPLEINHPYDRKHPLTFSPNPPSHPRNCSCYLCKIQWKGFVYSCSLCNFDLNLEDIFTPQTITNASHQHP